MEIVLDTLKNRYAKFDGRASRKEYWMFFLAYVIAICLALVVDSLLFGRAGLAYAIVVLVAFVPHLALGFRRLHDTEKTAWWLLLGLIPIIGGIVLIVFFCTRGTVGPNQYGPDPLAEGPTAAPSPIVS